MIDISTLVMILKLIVHTCVYCALHVVAMQLAIVAKLNVKINTVLLYMVDFFSVHAYFNCSCRYPLYKYSYSH